MSSKVKANKEEKKENIKKRFNPVFSPDVTLFTQIIALITAAIFFFLIISLAVTVFNGFFISKEEKFPKIPEEDMPSVFEKTDDEGNQLSTMDVFTQWWDAYKIGQASEKAIAKATKQKRNKKSEKEDKKDKKSKKVEEDDDDEEEEETESDED
ncbi:uncharacterized protein MONOS_6981 [Monocercomonoides exilis]|uniref:uncharacterized protein n=1 Tax=Monocercomonoides exilis TaxID=2049356 RepID=UPI003559EDDA|nr:hypothetical protein MONOS_6981 [Monocercomonoides exilis]|eukprot:MONOS_6981.1-p1 / transcript=MONOS_6981.1 / gene=MONOS_6981 / organism=Monocercomonoides_exilis_PA203 / gene_product=unspecified product / transcript_product=unspecified product / location=Mono_scaffold00230:1552-2095(-) / protein_length=154 / sequence_SO=supercontig / SO=protein_coding / is_pseudo=false